MEKEGNERGIDRQIDGKEKKKKENMMMIMMMMMMKLKEEGEKVVSRYEEHGRGIRRRDVPSSVPVINR